MKHKKTDREELLDLEHCRLFAPDHDGDVEIESYGETVYVPMSAIVWMAREWGEGVAPAIPSGES